MYYVDMTLSKEDRILVVHNDSIWKSINTISS